MQRIQGLPIVKEGNLRFELLHNGQRVAEHIVLARTGLDLLVDYGFILIEYPYPPRYIALVAKNPIPYH
jgi:hypothetical protein